MSEAEFEPTFVEPPRGRTRRVAASNGTSDGGSHGGGHGKTDGFGVGFDGSGDEPPLLDVSGDQTAAARFGPPSSRVGREDGPDRATWPQIERYRLERVLGFGGFGTVFLAIDETLDRKVAIKVPLAKWLSSDEFVERFLTEAQVLAGVDHSNVLPIYDFGRTDEGVVYAVSKYIDGQTLAERLVANRHGLESNIELLAVVLDALAAIHELGIVHRDVKPQNVLVDRSGVPFVSDFGLALRESQTDVLRQVGTLRYMSPEQCRGESHLVDGRADIYAVGVILYALLTGRLPFEAAHTQDLLERVLCGDPRPPRQVDRDVPRQLERICLKALSTRASDRYTTAYDFADELRGWLRAESADTQTLGGEPTVSELDRAPSSSGLGSPSGEMVVPRGLRAFGQRDAGFFLKLVPGPRASHGLPDVVEHWKDWIEDESAEPTSRVGVIYGPSGSGKSSLLQAGVLPQLDKSVSVICIQATPHDTEKTLRTSFERVLSTTIGDRDLADVAADLRTGRGLSGEKQVVIIVDQMEQWLATRRPLERSEFAGVLRQCDGKRLKAVLLVRDEFWLPLSRLLEFLEVPFQSGRNAVVVDLFDKRHARSVLHEFGIGYQRLPPSADELTSEQTRFLDDAIDALATDGSVYPVRIAIFAEMMKSRDWTQSSLRSSGGVGAIGVRFLEDSFTSETTTERYRMHTDAAARVLAKLLPEGQSQIRGQSPTVTELRTASGYAEQPSAFSDLLDILESELRLISVAREIIRTGDRTHETREIPRLNEDTRYLLAHEYLIVPVREWLHRRQRNSFRGRTLLAYENSLADWKSHRTTKFLPWFTDWLRFHAVLRPKLMADEGRAMMREANRFYGRRLLLAGVALLAALGAFWSLERAAEVATQTQLIQSASIDRLPSVLDPPFPAEPEVAARLADWLGSDRSRDVNPLAALTALQAYGQSPSGWVEAMLAATPRQRAVITGMPRLQGNRVAKLFRPVLFDSERSPADRMAAAQAYLLTADKPDAEALTRIRDDEEIALELIANRLFIDELTAAFEPLKRPLLAHFQRIVPQDTRTPEAVVATDYLLEWAENDPAIAFDYLYDPNDWQEADFQRLIARHARDNAGPMRDLVNRAAAAAASGERLDSNLDDRQFRRAGLSLAVLLREFGSRNVEADLLDRLRHRPEPALRVELIHRLPTQGIAASMLERWLDVAIREKNDDAAAALLMMLAGRSGVSPAAQDTAIRLFRSSDSAEVHAAAEVCLRRWDRFDPDLVRTDQPLPQDPRAWRINSQSQTMVRVPGAVLAAWTSEFGPDGPLDGYDLEVAASEVTVEQYLRFAPGDYIHFDQSPTNAHPANVVTFSEAINYCRWLTTQEGLPESEQCYPPADEPLDDSWSPHRDHRRRSGYRLPTLAEWRAIATGHAKPSLPYPTGRSWVRLQPFENFVVSDKDTNLLPHERLPHSLGVFATSGNVIEWSETTKERQRMLLGQKLILGREPYPIDGDGRATSPETRWNSIGMRVYRTIPGRK